MRRSKLFPSSAARAAAAVLGVLCAVALASGCDTVAELSIDQRDFTGVASPGVVNSQACGVDSTDTEFVLTFTPTDADGAVIAPGQVINGQVLELGAGDAQFGDDDIELVDSILFPAEDVPCAGDGDCTDPLTCQPLNPARQDSATACGLPINLGTLQRGVIYDEGADDKYVAIVMDYSSSLLGLAENGNVDPTRSTDPRDQRIAAAQNFRLSLGSSDFRNDVEMCIVSFGGTGSDLSAVAFRPTPQSCMTDDFTSVGNELGRLGIGEGAASPLWSAIQETINGSDQGFTGMANLDGDRSIVVFTDGPDDDSVSADFESVRNAAQTNSVAVHIVHLDNPPAGDERTGPIDEFARLACASGGSYQYATSPDDLRNYFDVLADTIPTSYEVDGQLVTLADNSVDLDEGCYRLTTGVRVTLAGQQITRQFSGDKTYTPTQSIIDDRLVVCKRPVPVPNDGENGDGGGGGAE